jgi:hypothetical protein
MAKQSINPVEKHLEKGVVGLCGIGLLYVLVMFLARSPNRIDVAGKTATPSNIDQIVLEEAKGIQAVIRNSQVTEETIEEPIAKLASASMVLGFPNASRSLPRPVPPLPPVPDIVSGPNRSVQLVEIPPPHDVRVVVGRASIELPSQIEIGFEVRRPTMPTLPTDTNFAIVSGLFDREKTREKSREMGYSPLRAEPMLLGAELQRRERLPNGETTEWINVNPLRDFTLPGPPEINLIKQGKQVFVDEQSRDLYQEYENLVNNEGLQLLRPLLPQRVENDGSWPYPKYADLNLEIDLMDKDLNWSGGDRYAARPNADLGNNQMPNQPAWDFGDYDQRMAAIDKLRKAGDLLIALDAAKQLKNKIDLTKEVNATTQQLAKVVEIINTLNQQANLQFEAEQERKPVPEQIVWLADGMPGALPGGHTYEYRMRFITLNTYAARPGDLANPDDAHNGYLFSEWSEPTEAVYVPNDTTFFVSRADPARGDAKVNIFKWVRGGWYESPDSPRVAPGERILTSGEIVVAGAPTQVDFDPQVRVVALEGGRKVQGVDYKRGGTIEVKPEAVDSEVVVYVDQFGTIRERIVDVDKKAQKLFENTIRR